MNDIETNTARDLNNLKERQFEISKNPDGTVTLRIADGEQTFSLQGLEAIISGLARARSSHPDPVPAAPPWTHEVGEVVAMHPIDRPNFWVWRAPLDGGTILALRHGGYGWLAFHFPPDQAPELLELLRQSTMHQPAAGNA